MTQNKLLTHPAADEFPMMDDTRFKSLCASIQEHGQREPIVLLDGKILDGRNRYKACLELGIEPKVRHAPSDTNPWDHVWISNGERRDITDEQRALIWLHCSEQNVAWQAEQQRIKDEANAKRAEATRAQHEVSTPRRGEKKVLVVGQNDPPPNADPPAKVHATRNAAATAAKVSPSTMKRAETLARNRPDLAAKVRAGVMRPTKARQAMKADAVKSNLEKLAATDTRPPAEKEYDVIVIDPPWPMQKIKRDVAPDQAGFDYPTMTIKEITEIKVPAAEDCHLWLWTTHKYLPDALAILPSWGFKYLCAFVWHKPGGFQPFYLPQYNCEFALYARRGKPEFVDLKSFKLCFNAPRGAHSEKPEEFYAMVRRVTAGRRLDMFNRRQIDGFEGWGQETPVK